MALSTGLSCLMALLLSVILVAGMQLSRAWLSSSKQLTIFGGFLGSVLFVLLLTMVNNAENILFVKGFQADIFPEVAVCILVACFVSGLINPVSGTTCFIFSLFAAYYLQQLGRDLYGTAKQPGLAPLQQKKRKN